MTHYIELHYVSPNSRRSPSNCRLQSPNVFCAPSTADPLTLRQHLGQANVPWDNHTGVRSISLLFFFVFVAAADAHMRRIWNFRTNRRIWWHPFSPHPHIARMPLKCTSPHNRECVCSRRTRENIIWNIQFGHHQRIKYMRNSLLNSIASIKSRSWISHHKVERVSTNVLTGCTYQFWAMDKEIAEWKVGHLIR